MTSHRPTEARQRGVNGVPSREELEAVFLQKYGDPARVGWSPRRRWRHRYFQPAEVYEAIVRKAVFEGCSWIDVGGGHDIFPENRALARELVARAGRVVAVDPSPNVLDNQYVHERVQSTLEDYRSDRPFDLATFRMVVEHVPDPDRLLASLSRLLSPGGIAIVFTVNVWSPITLVSRFTPFALHNPIKRLFWNVDEKDTFPVEYKMNSARTLGRLFDRHGFDEVAFAYLDDLSTLGSQRYLNWIELGVWRALRSLNVRYPENCLLGVYRKR